MEEKTERATKNSQFKKKRKKKERKRRRKSSSIDDRDRWPFREWAEAEEKKGKKKGRRRDSVLAGPKHCLWRRRKEEDGRWWRRRVAEQRHRLVPDGCRRRRGAAWGRWGKVQAQSKLGFRLLIAGWQQTRRAWAKGLKSWFLFFKDNIKIF